MKKMLCGMTMLILSLSLQTGCDEQLWNEIVDTMHFPPDVVDQVVDAVEEIANPEPAEPQEESPSEPDSRNPRAWRRPAQRP